MKNKILIFIALVCFTFLLLEVPKQYYKIQDENLLLEQGSEQYEKTQTNTLNDFSYKIYSFFNYATGLPTNGIGYTNELTEEETTVVLEKVMGELKLLIGEHDKRLLPMIDNAPISSRCFTAQVFHRREDMQYIWEVGLIELLTPKNNFPFISVIYDTDSYKIIMLTWEVPVEEMEYLTDSYIYGWGSALGYYEDVSKEIYIEDNISHGIIYPVPLPYKYVETSTLYCDLRELADYYWARKYLDEKIQE